MEKVITRFAPSPTGHLHIGGLRTALFNYLFAKKHNGDFYLRIEDTDSLRNSQEAVDAIIQAFEWVGLKPDGKIEYQSQRFHIYQHYIDELLRTNKAYYCYMTKEELEQLRFWQEANKLTPGYDRRYRDFKGEPPHNSPVVRIKAPLEGEISFYDEIKGSVIFPSAEIDDFIIARADGSPTYNFVVAIDDALMGVNYIIRGDDHLSNTPKQIVVYNALGLKTPRFCHVPMILGNDGHKLSKRHGALSVMEYKKAGFLPQALLNFLVRLGWSYGDEEIFSLEEMIEKFDTSHLSSSPSMYDHKKLLWLNSQYIKSSDNTLLKELITQSDEEILQICKKLNEKQLDVLINESKLRANTIPQIISVIKDIFYPPGEFEPNLFEKQKLNPLSKQILTDFLEVLSFINTKTQDEITSSLHSLSHNIGVKPGSIMLLIRLALLRKPGGIGIAETIFLLEKKDIETRVLHLLHSLK